MLTGPEKAVLFLLAMEESVAGPIVSELSEADLRRLRTVAATMREVPAGAVESTCREYLEKAASAIAVPRGGLRYLRRLSAGALGEELTRAVFEDGVTSPFHRLESAPPDAVAAMLVKEPPQIAGAVLARLSPTAAAAILAELPAENQTAAVAHIGRMTELPAHALEDMAAALASELPNSDSVTLVSVDGVARAAKVLNSISREVSGGILNNLVSADEALANEIKLAMFTFDDLMRVDPRSMREILREVATDRLTVALKGAGKEVMEAIFAGLSQRAADLIRDDLEIQGNIKKAEVEKARAEIVQAALRLESEGRVDLGREEL
jgi:flagellar motor switch protein FliG